MGFKLKRIQSMSGTSISIKFMKKALFFVPLIPLFSDSFFHLMRKLSKKQRLDSSHIICNYCSDLSWYILIS